MFLNEGFRYVGIDFETTGLDTKHDSPIQIGIVELNAQGEIIDQFQSLIKPDKDLKALKNIVSFLTHIKTAELVFAPSSSEIAQKIQHFFSPTTILIGHNISFDLAFLKKILPEVPFYASFDTFALAQALVPYPPSYALEILVRFLSDKPKFSRWKQRLGIDVSSSETGEAMVFHDAWYDTKCTLVLFCYLVEFVQELRVTYPLLAQLLAKSEGVTLMELLPGILPAISPLKESLPSLKKTAPSATSFATFPYPISLSKEPSLQRFYVGNLDFKKLLISLTADKKVIFAFANAPKLDIAKNLLFDLGVKNIGFAKDEQTISAEKLQAFLQQPHFEQFELYFLLKYLSHLFWGYGVLHLNSKGDYFVYQLLKDERKRIAYPLVLTTHQGLYTLLEKEAEQYAEYAIVFFDLERWYKNYNAYLSRVCDLYYLQNFLDMMKYKYQKMLSEHSVILAFDTFFTVFLGILWGEAKQLFLGRSEDELICNPLV